MFIAASNISARIFFSGWAWPVATVSENRSFAATHAAAPTFHLTSPGGESHSAISDIYVRRRRENGTCTCRI